MTRQQLFHDLRMLRAVRKRASFVQALRENFGGLALTVGAVTSRLEKQQEISAHFINGDRALDKWSELRTALYVAELGTVSAAATALGYHRATVNRHIDALEAEIGTRIFLRHGRGYTLTETGEEVLRVARTTREMTEDLSGRLKSERARVSGEIRISMLAPLLGLIMPSIAIFKEENPDCVVEVDTSEELVRLEYGEAHVAIRAGEKPKHPDYIVHGLGRINLNLYAHESYIARFGLPKDTDDLAGHLFVGARQEDRRFPFWPWFEQNVRPEQIILSSPDIWVNVEAIARGLGMGFLGEHEATERPGLQPVFPPSRLWFVRLWLTTHIDLHRTDKVQALTRLIKAEFNSASK